MSDTTKIEWTDYTFNGWIGCTKVAPGCANCYAESDMDTRRGRAKWGPNGTRSKTSEANWRKPIKWNRTPLLKCNDCGLEAEGEPVLNGEAFDDYSWNFECSHCESQSYTIRRPRVFCASLADVFEDWEGPIVDHEGCSLWRCGNCRKIKSGAKPGIQKFGPACCGPPSNPLTIDDLRRDLFDLIDATPNLDWLLLTKRPENVLRMWPLTPGVPAHLTDADPLARRPTEYAYRPNVWLGTSISDQETADKAVPELLKCRDLAPVLFLSVEPLLGPVALPEYAEAENGDCWMDPVRNRRGCINWVIVGGESGPGARPCNVEDVRQVVGQCKAAGVPCFVKQLGANATMFVKNHNDVRVVPESITMPEHVVSDVRDRWLTDFLRDKKGGDPAEWPADLRVRQFPKVEVTL